MTTKNKPNDLSRKLLETIALDFIVNDLDAKDLSSKYNLSINSSYQLISKLNLVQKRDKYREKVLQKSLDRCATFQSKIIFKATELLHTHVERLSQRSRESENSILTSSEIRDVMAILQIISKENRLDNDKPTDRSISTVQVEFPQGFTPITAAKKNIVDAEFKEVKPEVKEIKEEPEEDDIIVEIDDEIIGNPLG